MARKTQHDYVALREAYRLTPVSLSDSEFAKKHGIPLRTFQDRKRKDDKAGEPWERDLSSAVKSQTRQMQQRVAAGLDKNQPITDEAVAIATAASTNFLVLERHEKMLGKTMNRIEEGLDLLKAQHKQGFVVIEKRTKEGTDLIQADVACDYVAKTVSGLTTALEKVVKMQRHHIGVDDEDSTASYEDDLEALANEMDADED